MELIDQILMLKMHDYIQKAPVSGLTGTVLSSTRAEAAILVCK